MVSLIRRVTDLRTLIQDWHLSRKKIGFVPTMGALHEGHLSLIRASLQATEKTVVSIFVNPLQFDRKNDLETYPRPELEDRTLLEEAGVHALFLPSRDDVYPGGFSTRVVQSGLVKHLCGASRPGHFEGVLTVVLKLLNMVSPDVAFFGQKDYQQVAVIRRMVLDLNVPTEIRVLPTWRESDGLAMSSRNVLLSAEQRLVAPGIYAALRSTEMLFRSGKSDAATIRRVLSDQLSALRGVRLDYAECCDPATLVPRAENVEAGDLLAAAVFFDQVRLIDNLILSNGST